MFDMRLMFYLVIPNALYMLPFGIKHLTPSTSLYISNRIKSYLAHPHRIRSILHNTFLFPTPITKLLRLRREISIVEH